MNKSLVSTKNMVLTGVTVAFCVLLPMLVRMIPNGGVMFSPMHLPVLIAGLAFGWPAGLISGILGPLLSSLINGMPPAPRLPGMMIELAIYGFLTGWLISGPFHSKRNYRNLYISLIIAMLTGRIIAGLFNALLFSGGHAYSLQVWAGAYFVSSFPAILIQLLIIPSLVIALSRARLTPEEQL